MLLFGDMNMAYADESSVCRAAIHAGKIPDGGGYVVVVKRLGDAFYSESSRNGVRTKSRGPSTGSFVFGSMSDFQFSALNVGNSEHSLQQSVSACCSTKAKDLPAQTTLVICPYGCLTQNAPVWGHGYGYADESSVCRAAIHAGIIPDGGGYVVVVKRSGKAFYSESSRNGVTTKSRGPSTGSFVFGSMSDFEFSALNGGNSEHSLQTSDKTPTPKLERGYFSTWR
ncbi:cysteine-rich secretory protein LCCL domain-containing 2-like [Bufo gargarizans]|uniref:cysteine-rich secretory protein LCCL domain-containing 2-like n=1 Tax=Bufo gargarizans TaxID=30331 RepID=UPI001CF340E4|nr:cysteine-rich secretory protein LCCL domain-containing 2-like [Bufo gargarizans]